MDIPSVATRQQSCSAMRGYWSAVNAPAPWRPVRGLVVLLGERLRAEGRACRQVHAGGDAQGVRAASAEGGWWSEGETAVTPLGVAVDRVWARFGRERLVPGHATGGMWAGEKISFVRVPGG